MNHLKNIISNYLFIIYIVLWVVFVVCFRFIIHENKSFYLLMSIISNDFQDNLKIPWNIQQVFIFL
ncbi:hypothetical protein [Malacoplasma penetrans HF-2]|uniref:Uncharacterized protein n=1 Tax=Malacoplasma penetrans (strain HF-2) TaxID=272633 RepID=Q8EVL9_MALP2|nr:hypothetical protein [Malacoplasma penetrans HF-2]